MRAYAWTYMHMLAFMHTHTTLINHSHRKQVTQTIQCPQHLMMGYEEVAGMTSGCVNTMGRIAAAVAVAVAGPVAGTSTHGHCNRQKVAANRSSSQKPLCYCYSLTRMERTLGRAGTRSRGLLNPSRGGSPVGDSPSCPELPDLLPLPD